MPTDLTERLAAKLMEVNLPSDADASIYVATLPRPHAPGYRLRVGKDAADLLPLLLSEPELVAGLDPEVKREVLRTLCRERLATFGAAVAMPNAYQTYGNGFPVSVPVLIEAVLEILAPSPAPLEGTNDD